VRTPKTDRHQVRPVLGMQSDGTDAFNHRLRKCRTRHKCRVQAGIIQYLKDPTISPILTSTLIAAGTVSFNLVAGLVTEKKRADLTLEVQTSPSKLLAFHLHQTAIEAYSATV